MRKLNGQDVFDFAKIMKRSGLKDTCTELFKMGKEETANIEDLGIEFITSVIFACAEDGVDKMFFKLLANVVEKTPEETASMSIEALIETIKKISEENNLINFFKYAAKLRA